MIYTFYSYKGGVGRSMAVANVAEWLYRQGLRVVMVDWDLEAPGLESFFYQSKQELDAVRSQLGLIDMLTAYKRMFPRLPLPRTQTPGAPGQPAREHLAATLAVLEERLPPVSSMLYPIHAPQSSATTLPGRYGCCRRGGALKRPMTPTSASPVTRRRCRTSTGLTFTSHSKVKRILNGCDGSSLLKSWPISC
jgi:hypothetical protein